MDNNIPETRKRWFTDGAGMAYPRWSRTFCLLINLTLYALLNMFILRIQTGLWIQLEGPYHSEALIPTLLSPLNIFQYPSFIVVTALLMALLCTAPIIIAQLYNFLYAVPCFFVVFFLGNNPVLTLALLVSCAAVSFEPLRFKSKFVAAVLALAPVILYWGLFSGVNPERDALRWAVLYAPWGLAFFICVIIFAVVLTIGHFLRYRPGILLPIFGIALAGTVLLFRVNIGMNERDFQAEVYRHSPAQVDEFQSRSIQGLLEEELAQRKKLSPYIGEELLAAQLRMEWRWAFNSSNVTLSGNTDVSGRDNPISLARREALRLEWAKVTSLVYIDNFLRTHPDNKRKTVTSPAYIDNFLRTHPSDQREADALYYKAQLIDLKVDPRALRDENMLRFYQNIPSPHSEPVWKDIYNRFSESEAAIEARWRLACLTAGEKTRQNKQTYDFEEALKLLEQAQELCRKIQTKRLQSTRYISFLVRRMGTLFTQPEPTISDKELSSLLKRINKLKMLISSENRTGYKSHDQRLAKFAGLDPYQLDYEDKLKELMLDAPQPDPLQDNIELALAMLEKNTEDKIVRLTELSRHYVGRDGAAQAMLELAAILLEERKKSSHQADRQQLHLESTKLLQNVITSRSETYLAEEAKELLEKNPLE